MTAINPHKPADPLWLYDELMRNIEPELMSDKLDGIEAILEQDTPEQRKERLERYDRAFEKFDELYGAVEQECSVLAADLQQQTHDANEAVEAHERDDTLPSIERRIDSQ